MAQKKTQQAQQASPPKQFKLGCCSCWRSLSSTPVCLYSHFDASHMALRRVNLLPLFQRKWPRANSDWSPSSMSVVRLNLVRRPIFVDWPCLGWDVHSDIMDIPWEPTTFIFRGYSPYFKGSQPSTFIFPWVFGGPKIHSPWFPSYPMRNSKGEHGSKCMIPRLKENTCICTCVDGDTHISLLNHVYYIYTIHVKFCVTNPILTKVVN